MRIARLICSLLLIVGLLAIPVQSRAQVSVGISVRIGPPVLPVYVQPICPGPGYIWVPGRSEEHTSELQSQSNLVCRLLLEKKKRTDCACDRQTLPVERDSSSN